MRYIHRLIAISTVLLASNSYALGFFISALDWRPTETNDWAYVNSQTLPYQSIAYKTIDFGYTPGFRIGATYTGAWDGLLSYTRLYTTTNDSTVGNIQPSFLGSVNAKPSPAYLYLSGQVRQTIDYNIFDANIGKQFSPAALITLQPIVGLIGGWINQSIYASYQGSTSSNEKLTNNFSGIGPKIGIHTFIHLFDYQNYQSHLMVNFATAYLLGSWNVSDITKVTPTHTVIVNGVNHTMGSLAIQSLAGVQIEHKQFSANLAYEINQWFNQTQIFDNDTGAHNNDLVLQGLALTLAYHMN